MMEAARSPETMVFIIIISGVGLSPLGTAATSGLLYKPQMIDEGDCGGIGGMKIGRGNRSTRKHWYLSTIIQDITSQTTVILSVSMIAVLKSM
jgi:hypothetical protein